MNYIYAQTWCFLSSLNLCMCVIGQNISFRFTWWRLQMETFPALLAICAGNSPVSIEFLAQRPLTRSIDASFICASTNGWVNNGGAGDLKRRRTHYDVIVMIWYTAAFIILFWWIDIPHIEHANSLRPSETHKRQQTRPSLMSILSCNLFRNW